MKGMKRRIKLDDLTSNIGGKRGFFLLVMKKIGNKSDLKDQKELDGNKFKKLIQFKKNKKKILKYRNSLKKIQNSFIRQT